MDIELNFYRVKNFSYVVMDNYFSPSEISESIQELKDLKRLSAGGQFTGAAQAPDGAYKKSGSGVWLDDIYCDREASPILKATRKIFDERIYGPMVAFDAVFKFVKTSNFDRCLANYYTVGQKYEAHHDESRITAVILLGDGEFTGGGFAFPDQEVEVDFRQGRCVVFPSCVNHSSIPHLSADGGGCRMSIAQFIDKVKQP